MPTTAEIRDRIIAVMQAVEEIGQVQPYPRWSKRDATLKRHYAYRGQIRGWHITRVGFRETNQVGGLRTIITRWRIVGYLSISDEQETERLFEELLDRVCDVFRQEQYLNGIEAESWVGDAAGVQGENIGPVLFAGVLCHSAQLGLDTVHFIEGPGEIRPEDLIAG